MSHHRLPHWFKKKKEWVKAKWVLLPYTPFHGEKSLINLLTFTAVSEFCNKVKIWSQNECEKPLCFKTFCKKQ